MSFANTSDQFTVQQKKRNSDSPCVLDIAAS